MTRILNLMIGFFILSLLSFSSCSKENISIDEKNSNDNEILTEESQSNDEEFQYCFDNPNNPYEELGVQHNLGLDAIAASPEFGNLSTEEAYYVAFEAIANNMGVTEEMPFSEVESAFDLLNSPEPLLEVAAMLLAEEEISQEAHDIIIQLDELFNNNPDPHVFGIEVLSLEDAILQNGNLTTVELEILLGGTAVTRHSTCYWISAAMDPTSPWYPLLNDGSVDGNIATDRGFWDWVKEAWEDVKRFVKKDVTGVKRVRKKINKWVKIDGVLKFVVWGTVGVVYSIVN